jgi:TRAP-type mannitol/chloroaromatic compound transport system permease large subunit
MTPDTQHARTRQWDEVAVRPSRSSRRPRPAQAARRGSAGKTTIVSVVPFLAVLVVALGGIYIAWQKGSSGGGVGGVVAGTAMLAAAVARLMLPTRMVGLLAVRKRANDVVTLAIFGVGLIVAGLVLPR